ncbi:MAG: ferrous iron transport protein A [Thiobacillus sp.]|nr:ferrous iron transport protein A [Thiobacillus sp.]
MNLKDPQVGDRAKVAGFLETGGAYRRKLLSMGLTPGAEISVTRMAPMELYEWIGDAKEQTCQATI